MCVMLLGCYLERFTFIRISMTPSDMGDACSLLSFRSNGTSLCCYENYDEIVDYFVVKAC
jgi:hypothetical protein